MCLRAGVKPQPFFLGLGISEIGGGGIEKIEGGVVLKNIGGGY